MSIMRQPESFQSSTCIVVQPNDVLSGRGNAVKKHEGNVHFRELVQAVKNYYVAFPPNKKIHMSELVIQAIKSLRPPGRYLKEKETDCGIIWEEITTKEALQKTSQALREGQPDHRKSGLCSSIHGDEAVEEKLNEIWVVLTILTCKRNGDDISIPFSRPSPDSLSTDEKYPILESHQNIVGTSELIGKKYEYNKVNYINPIIPTTKSKGKVPEPTVSFSDSLPTVNENPYSEEVGSTDPFSFFENSRRKVYSCRSLDLDSDFDVQRMKPPKDVRAAEYKVDITVGTDGVDRLFTEKEMKNLSTMSFRDISSWSLWKTDSGIIIDPPLSEEVEATLESLTNQADGEKVLPENVHFVGSSTEGDNESVDKLFYENPKRKTYSCRSLDIDPEIAFHHVKPKDVKADDNRDTPTGSDSIDHLFLEKLIKFNTNAPCDSEISSWSLMKSEDGSKRTILTDRDAEDLIKFLERSISTMSVTHDKNFHRL